tara:strand:+ start:365 stop:736 length:372 start_codon:yes stop_codon:yes gene_type:complete
MYIFIYKYHKITNKINEMELLLIILLTYGISNIIVFGSIFGNLRDFAQTYNPNFLGALLSCMMCTPFWVGFILSLSFQLTGYGNFSPLYNNGLENIYLSVFLDACLLSGTTWLIHTFQEHFEV